MTAKAPTPMPEGMNRDNRPKAPAAPPMKITQTVEFKMSVEKDLPYTVVAYGMWMNFKSQSEYLDWADMIRERESV